MGAVKYPHALPCTEGMTVVPAIAGGSGMERYEWISAGDFEAGLFTKDAYLCHVAIVRGSLSAPEIAVVSYNAIVHGLRTWRWSRVAGTSNARTLLHPGQRSWLPPRQRVTRLGLVVEPPPATLKRLS